MYDHLAMLGVDHNDIRHPNILCAPECPPGWPGRVSPWTKKGYRWRLVDFEVSQKTNWDLDVFCRYHEDWVARLLDNLPEGRVLEMTDI